MSGAGNDRREIGRLKIAPGVDRQHDKRNRRIKNSGLVSGKNDTHGVVCRIFRRIKNGSS